MTVIQAVYADGVLTPREPLNLPEGSVLDVVLPKPQMTALERELDWLMHRTSEDIQAACDRIDATSTPPRPLPPGKTLADMVQGTWPGEETDEEIRDILEKLS